MPDCREIEESRVYSKRAKKVLRRDLCLSLASQINGLETEVSYKNSSHFVSFDFNPEYFEM